MEAKICRAVSCHYVCDRNGYVSVSLTWRRRCGVHGASSQLGGYPSIGVFAAVCLTLSQGSFLIRRRA
ncbi:hypothetical protein SK3146_05037 [Paenibacillus konkukensis]|uniref:Uncharacterized protein n=1 Tax=Paenibacillus konkukensis TaxID=2020716 RepID=A0ABY4RUM8_9BACL|nr:hypothetical protein SK3146_05037 [Paenibacillus konkukensis]